MMSIQLKIWKRLITNQASLSSHHVSTAMSLVPLAIYAKPHFRSPNFCTETTVPSTTPSDKGVVTEFLFNKCGFKEEDIKKAFNSRSRNLERKSVQICEEVLKLLNNCGLTTPAQIRKVVLYYPDILFYGNIKSKFSFLTTFLKEEDIGKLIYRDARFILFSEDRLRSAVSLLRKLGLDGEALSEVLTRQPRFLTSLEKDVMESFKNAEDLGLKKGSKMFPYALWALLGIGKEKLDRRLLCFSSLGFSEKQISNLLRRQPLLLSLSEEKVKRNVDFLVESGWLPLDDIAKYPSLFRVSLEKTIIPRFRVMEALKSMQMLKPEMSYRPIAKLTEKRFLEKYVNLNAECSSFLLDVYHGGKVEKLKRV